MPNTFSNYKFDYNQYKKRTTKNSYISFVILFLTIILLTGLAVFIKPIKTSNYKFYFVKANSFSTYSQANTLAQEIQKSGGAGYIHLDKKYHVLINFYQNKKDAESVAENLKNDYKNVEVYTISAKKFKNLQNLNKNQNKSMENLSNFTINLIKTLSILSIQYDKNEINYNQLNTKLNSIYDDYSELNDAFINQFKTDSKFNVCREYSHNIKNDLKILTEIYEENSNQQFKYLITDTVVNYCSLLNSF